MEEIKREIERCKRCANLGEVGVALVLAEAILGKMCGGSGHLLPLNWTGGMGLGRRWRNRSSTQWNWWARGILVTCSIQRGDGEGIRG